MAKKMMTIDGNTAAAHVAYAFTDVAAIFPITPSTTMAEVVDEWSAQGKKNIFGQTVNVVEMQSEAGAAGTFHGSLQAGALTTTFTASQGLLLMLPNMYKVAGELLPGVFHVSARAIASQALSIFGDHQDVMAARMTGCVMLAAGSVQEVADLAPVSHLAAIKGRLPFVNFFDGFRTSHEIQKVEVLDYEDYAEMIDREALKEFRSRALTPNNPVTRGTAQNSDIYFQTREASNIFYNNIIPIVEEYMAKIEEKTGRSYGLFNYYGAEDAKEIIVAMGSVTEAIEETIDELNARGEKYGLVKVHLFRPFSVEHLLKVIPQSVEKICVIDRTKEPGCNGEPLYLDVCSAFYGKENAPKIVGGRYGLASKDVTPSDIKAIFDNLKKDDSKNFFTVGIEDDVTFTSIPVEDELRIVTPGTVRCKFWGLGSDGTVGANKQAIKIIGENTDKYVQAYFAYDSKKSGGVTMSHLRFGDTPIRSTYLIDEADYIACHVQAYVNQYDLLKGLKKGGNFVLNTIWNEEEIERKLPAKMKRYIAENEINFYTVNATKIASEIGLGRRINMIMQSAFFKLAEIIPQEEATEYLKASIKKAYGKKGDKVVNMNYEAVEAGMNSLVKINVPESWKTATEEAKVETKKVTDFVKNIMNPMNSLEGDKLPVSAFNGLEDGTFPAGTAAYEKRGVATDVPEWNMAKCIQCNQCAFVCPHACIRPVLVTDEELAKAPVGFETKKATGKTLAGLNYRIQVSTLDCTGCNNCVDICPAPGKALEMKPLGTQVETEVANWDFSVSKEVSNKEHLTAGKTVKDSQFKQPLMEFSGACAGCGETPYIKLATQLFGDRMMIANATGCSSIWGGSAPSTPYTKNHEGKGPAWANSLFEDNAEHGFGMYLGQKVLRDQAIGKIEEMAASDKATDSFKAAAAKYLETKDDTKANTPATEALIAELEKAAADGCPTAPEVLAKKDYLAKKSVWIFGGDGWAYDIGFGGLDHVLASGENVNVMVFDTEMYSNTGGQASKASNIGEVCQFAAAGKEIGKKSLAEIAMSYGYVYVAQIALGANPAQALKAIEEAESYNGPSLIIGYAPCELHGIAKGGMNHCQDEMKKAVKAGYWNLFSFNPALKAEGKNPFTLTSKEGDGSYQDFLNNEARYTRLVKPFPERAERLFAKSEEVANERYQHLLKLVDLYK